MPSMSANHKVIPCQITQTIFSLNHTSSELLHIWCIGYLKLYEAQSQILARSAQRFLRYATPILRRFGQNGRGYQFSNDHNFVTIGPILLKVVSLERKLAELSKNAISFNV